VLNLRIRTGQVTLNLKDGRLESYETHVYARLKPREKSIDKSHAVGAH